jgi:hypothetical protein
MSGALLLFIILQNASAKRLPVQGKVVSAGLNFDQLQISKHFEIPFERGPELILV